MSVLRWTAERGLHELEPDELRAEAASLIGRAARLKSTDPRKARLFKRARRFFREARN